MLSVDQSATEQKKARQSEPICEKYLQMLLAAGGAQADTMALPLRLIRYKNHSLSPNFFACQACFSRKVRIFVLQSILKTMTKRAFFFSSFLIILLSLQAQTISIATDHTQLVLQVNAQKRLCQTYLGERLSEATDLSQLAMPMAGLSSSCIKGLEAYPVMGTEDYYEPTFEIRHSDGNPTSVLKYVRHSQHDGLTTITLRDELYPVEVTLYYKVFEREDVIQQWTEIRHEEKGKVSLGRYASSMLYFEASAYYLTEFASDWAKEMQMQSQQLQFGKKVVDSRLGTRANLMAQPFFEVANERKQLQREKRQLSIEMNQLRESVEYERKRLKDDERMLDKKQKIIQRSYALFDEDRARLKEEYRQVEQEKIRLRKANAAARKEVYATGLFFRGVDNMVALKKRYKDLMKIYHPDNICGDQEILIKINEEYEELKSRFAFARSGS